MQDLLPDVERGFAMVFAVEQQRSVYSTMTDSSRHMAYQLTVKENKRETGYRFMKKKKPYVDKRKLACTHRHTPGHTQETCFQVHGVLEWYKTLNDRKRKGPSNRNFAAAAVDGNETSADVSPTQNMAELMSNLIKLMQKNNLPNDPVTD
ncbi:UNVERIFIED_CONTAM: hypothetical protein Slati_0075400 [Sesamum latifolium]|uniref:Uncharacterized protein n=1 Tax=Sesamum latifolium TaxID=2727402 RepID=A0AAW2Y7W0_9LAMI